MSFFLNNKLEFIWTQMQAASVIWFAQLTLLADKLKAPPTSTLHILFGSFSPYGEVISVGNQKDTVWCSIDSFKILESSNDMILTTICSVATRWNAAYIPLVTLNSNCSEQYILKSWPFEYAYMWTKKNFLRWQENMPCHQELVQ